MRSIRLVNVTKYYKSECILQNFNLTIPAGSFFVLLGPSGSGKTTLLRLIDGFEVVDSGKIYLDDEDITKVPINKRNINTVFQSYALFPHLNVFENIAYGLRIKKLSEQEIQNKVNKVIKSVNLEKQINKSILQLSGGQKQRVAIARAIVNEPDVLLFDEPLAALDLKLREKMLEELIELQKTLKTTFVYVTHDQSEALAIADLIAIMNYDGEVEQLASPKDIYEFPVSSFVAKFIGNTNLISGKVNIQCPRSYLSTSEYGQFLISVDHNFKDQEDVIMSLRPEKIVVTKKDLQGFDNKLSGKICSKIYQGRSTIFTVCLENKEKIQVFYQNKDHIQDEIIRYGDEVNLYWQRDSVVLLKK